MSIDVVMPQMGESVAEGTIIKWMVKPGDQVEKDDPLFEISTDKVDAEVPSPVSGILTEIIVPVGETVEVGVKVAIIEGAGTTAGAAGTAAGNAGTAASTPAAAPSRTAAPAPAPAATASAPTATSPAPAARPATTDGRTIRSSPVARRLAREKGIELAAVRGTGRGGRVSKKDVIAYLESGGGAARPVASASAAPSGAPPPPPPEGFLDPGARGIGLQPVLDFAGDAESAVHSMNQMRRSISEHMVASRRTSAHVGSVFEFDFSRVYDLRKKWKADFRSRHGANLSVTTFMLHAIAPALRAWPIVNASIINETEIEYHRHVNLGVAVALPDGLIVPVLRHVERKGIGEIARELADLGERARSRKLVPDEVAGSTFTITNPGIFGALFGIPVINQPNAAILGMGGVSKRVVVTKDDAIAIRPVAYICMSYDHRIIDGAVADQFISDLKNRIENFPEEVLT